MQPHKNIRFSEQFSAFRTFYCYRRENRSEQVPFSSVVFDRRSFDQSKDYFASQKKQVPFSMAIGNAELMHECFPKHSHMETARMK